MPMIILVAPQPASVSNTLALGVGLTKSVVSHAQKPNLLAGIPNLLGLPLNCCSGPDLGVASFAPHESHIINKERPYRWSWGEI